MTLFVQQVANGLTVGSTYAVVTLGFSLIYCVMNSVNMAHPEIFMISMFAGLQAAKYLLPNYLVVLIFAVLAAGMLGLLLERAVLRPLKSPDLLIPLLGTVAASLILVTIAEAIFGPDPKSFPNLLPAVTLSIGGIRITASRLANLVVAFVIMLMVSYYVRRTKWGRATLAIAERMDVASAFGINVNRVAQVTVVFSSMMAGIAAVSVAEVYHSVWVHGGTPYAIKAFILMRLAGNKTVEGVVPLGLALGVIEALVTCYVSSSYRDVVAYVVLMAALYWKPAGLFGSFYLQ
jgi:branched-chain amino acid transport system permease protein